MGDCLFVGRERERAALSASADAAMAGHGRLVLLGGEPGIGKTRLAAETAEYARERGARVVWGRCQEAREPPPLWPWVQVLRACFRTPDLLPAPLAPRLKAVLAHLSPQAPSAAGDTDHFIVLEAITDLLGSVARETPLCLILDDLHAADDGSLVVLEHLAREIPDLPILVVATYDETEAWACPSRAPRFAELARHGTTFPIRGLDEPEVACLVDVVAGRRVQPEVTSRIHAATGGNPFIVIEVLRILVAERRLDVAGALPVPGPVRELLRRRVSRLSPRSVEALEAAAIVGHEFDVAVVADALGADAEEVRALLLPPADAGFVTRFANDRDHQRFTRSLVRDALVEGMPAARRVGLESRVQAARGAVPRAATSRNGGSAPNRFVRQGEYWTIVFTGYEVRLQHTRGLSYLARLLERPGVPIPAPDLVPPSTPKVRTSASDGAASDTERARVSGTRRIRAALARINGAHPALGEHLTATIRTGTRFVYTPDPTAPITWDVGTADPPVTSPR